MEEKVIDLLLGVAIGDALGVPYEFSSRTEMKNNPCKDMIGFQTHNQPPGTWSDDSSLTFCLAEAMANGYSLESTAINFIRWKNKAYWSAHQSIFDIGMTTSNSIRRLEGFLAKGNDKALKQLTIFSEERENGNGSLMRILPFLFHIKDKDISTQFNLVWENSALTHRHIRAAMSCMIYLKYTEYILNDFNKEAAYLKTRFDIECLWNEIRFEDGERDRFSRVIQNDIRNISMDKIMSGGYVIESLEASFWCILNTSSFESAVLTAINFGHDTDTTGAITGGIAALLYGKETIHPFWLASLARYDDILDLGKRLANKYS